MTRDPALDALLELHGEVLFINEDGYWVKFEIRRSRASETRPHGLRYSLTLHAPDGKRLVGFDNAHAIPVTASRTSRNRKASYDTTFDHKHRFRSISSYDYNDASALLADFWNEVDTVLRDRGLIP